MNIPTEHFTATPVYALSPCHEGGAHQPASPPASGQRAPLFKLGVPSVPGKTNKLDKDYGTSWLLWHSAFLILMCNTKNNATVLEHLL